MKKLTPFIDLVLYGNFWIALAAAAMVLQTQYLFSGEVQFNPFVGFVFFATHCLYAIHRIVGLNKVEPFQGQGRYSVIARFKNHIIFYAVISGIASFVMFWYLPVRWDWMLFVPAIISLAYVLPMLGKQRRLRDFALIKIFLIALVWSWITVVLTIREAHRPLDLSTFYLFAERACFIFAITLPFDIRDLEVDRFTGVKTIPALLGIVKTRGLIAFSLGLMVFFSWQNFETGFYSIIDFLVLLLAALISFIIVYFAPRIKHDYYFTGLVDGLMILQFLLIWWLS